MARKHTEETRQDNQDFLASVSGSAILLNIEDGTGKGYHTAVEIPQAILDLPQPFRSIGIIGLRYEAVRDGQGVAKKTAKENGDVGSALMSWAANYSPKVRDINFDTVDSKRIEIAANRLEDALKRNGKPTGNPASRLKAAPGWMNAKPERREAVENDLRQYFAETYTPTKRGSGGGVSDLGDVSDVD